MEKEYLEMSFYMEKVSGIRQNPRLGKGWIHTHKQLRDAVEAGANLSKNNQWGRGDTGYGMASYLKDGAVLGRLLSWSIP